MYEGDLTPPPPAYAEQEFDQKISTAQQVSLNAPQPPLGDEEQWEEWNDAAFHAAAQAISSLGSSRSSEGSVAGSSAIYHPPEKTGDDAQLPGVPAIEPLRIQKKARSPLGQPKPRPSWLAETEIDAQSGASGSIRHDIPPDDGDEEDHSIPPPPFTAVAPSLDGRPVVVMSYQPSGDSRSPSPLNSPIETPLQITAHGHDSVSLSRPSSRPLPDQPQPYVERFHASSQPTSRSHRPTRQSLPAIPPPHPHNVGQRPLTTISAKPMQSSVIPRMNFNPYVAYGQGGGVPELPPARHPAQHFDPNGFYNSAVAAHLSPAKTPARQSHLLSIPGQQNKHLSRPVSSHQSVLHDARTTTGNQLPRALTPGSRNVEPWPSGTPADIPVYPMNPYSQPPMDTRAWYSQNPQYRPG